MKNILQFLTTLLINAVPAVGWFFEQWSAGTTLAVYWFENLAACFFIGARILIQQRLSPKHGHFRYVGRQSTGSAGTFFSNFMTVALAFTIAHGVFLFVIIFILTKNGKGAEVGLNLESFGQGCLWVLLFLAMDFIIDLFRLRKQTFLWLENRVDRHLGRIMVVHLSLIFGMAGVAYTGATRAFFGVFVFLKTLADLSSITPQWNPKEPPPWLCRLMDKVPNVKGGKESFAEFWKKDNQTEANRKIANERPFTK